MIFVPKMKQLYTKRNHIFLRLIKKEETYNGEASGPRSFIEHVWQALMIVDFHGTAPRSRVKVFR